MDIMADNSITQYRPTSRSWVKLWVGEWLDGTTRFEMSGAQRAFWADLLALAGRSRFPGIICSGVISEKIVGYPLARYEGILNDPTVDVLETLHMFETNGKITITCTREDAPALYAVHILNWDKYQSEYQQKRQRVQYRKSTQNPQNVHTNVREKSSVEVEVEVEEEVEVEKKKNKVIAPSALVPTGTWLEFVEMRKKIRKPMTPKAAELIDRKLAKLQLEGNNPIEVLEQSIRNCWQDVFAIRRENGPGTTKSDVRDQRSADAITRVLGSASKMAGSVRPTLPPRGS